MTLDDLIYLILDLIEAVNALINWIKSFFN